MTSERRSSPNVLLAAINVSATQASRTSFRGLTDARLLPLSVDGLIMAASLVLLHETRHGRSAPVLARLMLAFGVDATVGANVAYGVAFGVLGALISAWSAVAFVGSAEMALSMIRPARHSLPGDRAGSALWVPFVPADALEAARAAFAVSVAASNPIIQRRMMTRFGLTRTQKRRLRQSMLADSNGHPFSVDS